MAEKDRLATAVSSQQGVIETFEKDFTEAIGQIEFLQQKNKRLEEQLHSTVEVVMLQYNSIDKYESKHSINKLFNLLQT